MPNVAPNTQTIALITPPSTRSAAPFVAEDNSLAIYVTIAATSSTEANRLIKDYGRACSKNSFSSHNGVTGPIR